MVDEAPLRETKYGLVADIRGWFVVNAREARWRDAGPLGAWCDFEGKKPFLQLGFNINVLLPGEPMGRYHRENGQEGFLVVSGTCVLIVEGQERPGQRDLPAPGRRRVRARGKDLPHVSPHRS